MKKMSLIGAIFALFLITACVHLALKPDEKANVDESQKLQNILDEISYRGCWEYQLGVFDCSNQTALLYNLLTMDGYKCEIIFGINFSSIFTSSGWHVWLIAEKTGKRFWVESVTKQIVSPDAFKHYIIQIRLGSLKQAKRLSRIIGLSHQWDY